MSVKRKYVGPEGGVNEEVARDTGESAIMEVGKIYEIDDKALAERMDLTLDWVTVKSSASKKRKSAARQARKTARTEGTGGAGERADQASLGQGAGESSETPGGGEGGKS